MLGPLSKITLITAIINHLSSVESFSLQLRPNVPVTSSFARASNNDHKNKEIQNGNFHRFHSITSRDLSLQASVGAVPTPIPRAVSNFALKIFNCIPNPIYFVAGSALLLGYHIRLFQLENSEQTTTWRQSQAEIRAQWSKHVRETEGWLYAVQTLRNAITANTFLATTVLSLLTVIGGKIWEIIRTTPPPITMAQQVLMAQFGAISLCMLSSAYHFLQSARVMTHAGFMFPVTTGTKVDRIMMKSQNAQWLGLRWLYISLSMIAWTVGGNKLFFGRNHENAGRLLYLVTEEEYSGKILLLYLASSIEH